MSIKDKVLQELGGLKRAQNYRTLEHLPRASFCHNDYLNLSSHPTLIQAAIRAAEAKGVGGKGSRLLGAHNDIFETFEHDIAATFKAPSALLFSSGYLANLALIRSLAELSDVVYSDEYNHASQIDAIRISGTAKKVFPHLSLEKIPAGDYPKNKSVVVITEALFSMEGTVVDFPRLMKTASETGSFLVLDEAHSGGLFTENGLGFHQQAPDWERLAVVTTFGKAFGVTGAAVLGPLWLKEFLINRARAFIYTTAPSPIAGALMREALHLSGTQGDARRELWRRAERFRALLADEIGGDHPSMRNWQRGKWAERSPVVPIHIPGNDNALRIVESMRELGFVLKAIRYPTVPHGMERIRVSLNLAVSQEETEQLGWAIAKKIREFSY